MKTKRNQICFILSANSEYEPAIVSGPFLEKEAKGMLKKTVVQRLEELNKELSTDWAGEAETLYQRASETEDIAWSEYHETGLSLNPGVSASIYLCDGFTEQLSVCTYDCKGIPAPKQAEMFMWLLSQNPEVKDLVYRMIWAEHVARDIMERADELDEKIDLFEAQEAASRYVDGEYDCNLDYWANIDNLLGW